MVYTIFSYPRLFLPLDKYSKIPLQLQKIAIGTQTARSEGHLNSIFWMIE